MKGNLFEGVTQLADVFFNGRPAPSAPVASSKSGVTIQELIKRKSSVILHAGKLYRVTVEETEVKA